MHPEIKKRYIAFAAMVILLAGIVAYFAFATQTPAKTSGGMMGGGEVQQSAENPAVNAATGAVVIPADVWKVSSGISYENERFPITGPFPDILVVNRHTLFKDIKITATEISVIAINTEFPKDGDSTGFYMYFRKGKEDTKYIAVNVYSTPIPLGSGGHYKYKVERPPETLGASWVTIDDFK